MSGRQVLVVDDELSVRTLYRTAFEHLGVETFLTPNGEEFFTLLDQGDFSLAIVDLLMVSPNGFEIIERLEEQNSPLRVLVISAHIDHSIANRLDGYSNVLGWLSKPFKIGELEMLLEEHFAPQA